MIYYSVMMASVLCVLDGDMLRSGADKAYLR